MSITKENYKNEENYENESTFENAAETDFKNESIGSTGVDSSKNTGVPTVSIQDMDHKYGSRM